MSIFRNHYRHADCPEEPGIEWQDTWDCMCNDRCPSCNAEIEPHHSEDLELDEPWLVTAEHRPDLRIRFSTEEEGSEWIGNQEDKGNVIAGLYSLENLGELP